MNKILKIVLLVLIVFVIVWGIFLWKKTALDYDNDIKIKDGRYNLHLNVKNVSRDAQNDSIVQISLRIKNYSFHKTAIRGMNYQLLNMHDSVLSNCYTYLDMQQSESTMVDLKAHGTSIIDLYCNNYGVDFSKLKILVLTGNKQLDDGTYEFYYDDYYIDLK